MKHVYTDMLRHNLTVPRCGDRGTHFAFLHAPFNNYRALAGRNSAVIMVDHVMNNDTAQYTSSRANTVFTIFACVVNSFRNKEPKADQQSVNAKPMKAKSIAKPNSLPY